jgi:co-chaperonin GroES (HSP10)
MTTPNIRPRRDWAMVLNEPRKTFLMKSGIVLPSSETGVEKVTESAGHIIRLGPSDKLIEKLGLRIGDRVIYRAFMKHHMPVPSEEVWQHDGSKKEFFLMDVADIMAVVPEDADIGVFSRPSQHAVESVDEEGQVKMRARP